MEHLKVSFINPQSDILVNSPHKGQKAGKIFKSVLDDYSSAVSHTQFTTNNPFVVPSSREISQAARTDTTFGKAAIGAYKKQDNHYAKLNRISDWEKYKDDQLLSNPGGDHYYLEQKKVVTELKDQESFWGRVGKDLSDACGNLKNFFKNLLFGSKIQYRDKDNQIKESTQKGLVGSVVDFFKDFGSALSFGTWRPDGEKAPQGFTKRCCFFFSKMKEAIFGDIVQGVSGSIVHMGEDILFAGWNMLETIPDATIGNFKKGRELTTAVFDNGQVAIDYMTDIIPSGDAWLRVHSTDLKKLKLPVFHNAKMPEHNTEDVRWRHVRNTPFRKTIETIGSLLTNVLTLKILGQIKLLGDERHQRN